MNNPTVSAAGVVDEQAIPLGPFDHVRAAALLRAALREIIQDEHALASDSNSKKSTASDIAQQALDATAQVFSHEQVQDTGSQLDVAIQHIPVIVPPSEESVIPWDQTTAYTRDLNALEAMEQEIKSWRSAWKRGAAYRQGHHAARLAAANLVSIQGFKNIAVPAVFDTRKIHVALTQAYTCGALRSASTPIESNADTEADRLMRAWNFIGATHTAGASDRKCLQIDAGVIA